MTTTDLRPDPGFTPYQLEFFSQFVSEARPGSVHLLLAPVGTGKSYAMASTVSELVRSERIHRVLILCPAPLTTQWRYLLARWGQKPVVVDSRALRVLRQQLGSSPDSWPAGVYVMSVDLAKRSDARELLMAENWDLTVVDDAHALTGQRLLLVEELTRADTVATLLATHVQDGVPASLAVDATPIDWCDAVAEFRARQEEGASPPLVRETRTYRRTEEEAAIANLVIECARELCQLKGMVLLQRASSSICSLEDSLVRWVESPEQADELRDRLEDLLLSVEQLRTDSRLACFKGLVEELVGKGVGHVVVFCEYRATLDYLAAAVERLDFPDFGLHGGMTDEDRRQIIDNFEHDGGLLITTATASEALSLNLVEAAIHYDLPTSAAAFAQRQGRYHRYGRQRQCTVYFFEDETGCLPLEDLLLRMTRKLDLVTGEMGFDVEQFFREIVK